MQTSYSRVYVDTLGVWVGQRQKMANDTESRRQSIRMTQSSTSVKSKWTKCSLDAQGPRLRPDGANDAILFCVPLVLSLTLMLSRVQGPWKIATLSCSASMKERCQKAKLMPSTFFGDKGHESKCVILVATFACTTSMSFKPLVPHIGIQYHLSCSIRGTRAQGLCFVVTSYRRNTFFLLGALILSCLYSYRVSQRTRALSKARNRKQMKFMNAFEKEKHLQYTIRIRTCVFFHMQEHFCWSVEMNQIGCGVMTRTLNTSIIAKENKLSIKILAVECHGVQFCIVGQWQTLFILSKN